MTQLELAFVAPIHGPWFAPLCGSIGRAHVWSGDAAVEWPDRVAEVRVRHQAAVNFICKTGRRGKQLRYVFATPWQREKAFP